jgi:hypothetical protein
MRAIIAVASLNLVLAFATAARAEGTKPSSEASEATASAGKSLTDSAKQSGSVLTFYGLRKLEEDPQISDEEKLKEWQAFIGRASEQIQYARKAVDRWKNAARLRLVESARNADRDPKVDFKEKINRWKEVSRLYPKDPEARNAQKRIAHWTQEQTKKLVAAAEEVERARKSKVERIHAWMEVLTWVDQGSEAKAANKRIDGLQDQLFSEAKSVDAIARVDDRTKHAAWKDVLAGRPTKDQQKIAERRIAELEAVLKPDLPPPAPTAQKSDGGAADGAK